ncbi:PIN domain-containing protein [Phenylobacterium sp.]|uniref:PIN domain-containing protein n=1 Tax=Phenylobacterium sp. TaxID=1871053 RepID=UPI002BF3DD6F|nr:PIN domain-containing protein [Phenylobacterium sp.]HVI34077.1 PIN domain-containing protein [Phenylobacterium sp.]
MPFDAITIDANVAYRNGFDFEHGLLAELRQFAHGEVKFVLSEVVLREIRKGMAAKAVSARDKLRNAIKDGLEQGLIPAEKTDDVAKTAQELVAPRQAAEARIKAFMEETGAQVVEADEIDVSDVVDLYFASQPPFEASGNKKAEFPDAIALLSLQSWAGQRGAKVLAVSQDEGWKAFATSVESLCVVDDLAQALSVLQAQAEAPEKAAQKTLGLLKTGQAPELEEKFRSSLEWAVQNLDVEPAGDSYYYFEAELSGIQFQHYELVEEETGKFELVIVRVEEGELVCQAQVIITATVEASFNLRQWDSVDREYIRLGSTSASTAVEFEAGALITFSGDPQDPEAQLAIDHVDLVDAIDSVDFGEIEPDRGDYYYE